MSAWPKTVKYFLNSSKEYNAEIAADIGLDESLLDKFSFVCYEVQVTLVVWEDGQAQLVAVGSSKVDPPIVVSVGRGS